MHKYEYMWLTQADLTFEFGLQQLPAALERLNLLGEQGWYTVSFNGDLDGFFTMLLIREIPNVG
jgi:hypothetical protein